MIIIIIITRPCLNYPTMSELSHYLSKLPNQNNSNDNNNNDNYNNMNTK